ncbi:hypothetical protein AB0392_34275 [Nonomuraea angiospora]|uniref:hypothetical protein n=1 Tax=Nonomuraea angiospora TaxID=46172 RepID=UPI00344B08EF
MTDVLDGHGADLFARAISPLKAMLRIVTPAQARNGVVASACELHRLPLTEEGCAEPSTRLRRPLGGPAITGAHELHRVLDTGAVGTVDCLIRLDERTVLGTPFISQRFWTVDLATGHGTDHGRAAPGGGQITRTWYADGAANLAAYAGGELTAYVPTRAARFPDNPRAVAADYRGKEAPPLGRRDAAMVLQHRENRPRGLARAREITLMESPACLRHAKPSQGHDLGGCNYWQAQRGRAERWSILE